MSRPSEYSEVYLERTAHYLSGYVESEVIPTIEGLALSLGVARSTVYEWGEQHAEFSDILEKLRCQQAQVLISGGLSGKFNATMSKMMLSKHGYYEEKYPIKIVDADSKLIGITYVTPLE